MPHPLAGKDSSAARKGERNAYLNEGEFARVPVYDAQRLKPGNELEGPAIVEKPNTTIVVYPKSRAFVDTHENLILELL
jgi:N-methylhydantoinase A/oxoprolinase/acetone carboxylase beta subunit